MISPCKKITDIPKFARFWPCLHYLHNKNKIPRKHFVAQMKIIRKPTCKYSCWLPKAERISRSHNVTPALLMRPLNVWAHLKVQFATSSSLLVLSLHPGAENSLIPSGPSKLELSSRDVTAQKLSNSHSGKSNTSRTTSTLLVCSALWKKDQRSSSAGA